MADEAVSAWTRTLERDRESGLDMRFQLLNEDLRQRGQTYQRRLRTTVRVTPELLARLTASSSSYLRLKSGATP